MAKKATNAAAKSPTPAQIKRLAAKMGLLDGKSAAEIDHWTASVARRPDAVDYLRSVARARDQAQRAGATEDHTWGETETTVRRPESSAEPADAEAKRATATRVPNTIEAPKLPPVETVIIQVPLVIGPWHPDGYGVSQKNPPSRLRLPDRRLRPDQAHAIARLFNGAIASKATMISGRQVCTKEDVVLYLLEQVSQAIDQHDKQAE